MAWTLGPPEEAFPGPQLTAVTARGHGVQSSRGQTKQRHLQDPRVGFWQRGLRFLAVCPLCTGTERLAFVLPSGLKGASSFLYEENGAVRLLLLESPEEVKYTG